MSAAETPLVLQFAQDLCRKLNLQRVLPYHVVWARLFDVHGNPVYRKWPNKGDQWVSYHTPVLWKDVLILPSIMEGKLGPEDWRPLVASSVIYWGRLRSRDNRSSILRTIPVLALLGFLLSDFVFQFSFFPNPVFLAVYIASVVAAAAFFLASSMAISSRIHLLADSEAADLFGKESFVEVLRKIEQLEQFEVESGKSKAADWMEAMGCPRIAKRIENLQAYVGETSTTK